MTIEDFLSPDSSRRRKTLGQLSRALKKSKIFASSFENRLTNFVHDRNKFIHELWLEQRISHSEIKGLPSKKELEEIHEFIKKLAREAKYFDKVFRGFLYTLDKSVKANAKQIKASPFRRWTKYSQEFIEVLRDEREDQQL